MSGVVFCLANELLVSENKNGSFQSTGAQIELKSWVILESPFDA